MTSKNEIRSSLPSDFIVWVNAQTAAAMLDYSPKKFEDDIRYSVGFQLKGDEQKPGRFSVEMLKEYGNGK